MTARARIRKNPNTMDINSRPAILVVDDDPDILLAAEMVLKEEFGPVQTLGKPGQLPALLAAQSFDVILLDMNYAMGVTSGEEGLTWLRHIKQQAPETNVVVMTAYGGMNLAIAAIKQGASDFVVKPWDNDKLIATIGAAVNHSRSAREVSRLHTRQRLLNQFVGQDFGQIIGNSEALAEVLATVDKVAGTDANVLILGENGCGKELVARALHNQSRRADQCFVNVDIGAIAESLFEAELFGHTRGAFTDARNDRAGRFEVADGGTLFLDEIGNINPQMQAKLLGVLESRTLTRVGSDKAIPVDVRLVCATNMPLYAMIEDGRFRQDLLYRINTVELQVPPLRERLTDIPVLADHFLALFCRKYNKPGIGIARKTLDKLRQWHWPGNIREVQHAMERALILCDGDELQPEDFVLERHRTAQAVAPAPQSLKLEDMERDTIRRALDKHAHNLSRTAAELGLSRATLYRKMDKYGL